MSILQECNQL